MRSWSSNVEHRPKSNPSDGRTFEPEVGFPRRARSALPNARRALIAARLAFGALVAVCAAWTAGCGGASFETVTELPKTPRRPDGVVLEHPLTVPDAEERGKTDGTLLALREPFELRALVELVKVYFRAWEHEDVEALARLLTPDAVLLRRPGASVVDSFRLRMRTYEYQRIAGLEVARFDHLERYGYGDVVVAQRPLEMHEGDVLVRVPVLVSRVSGDPLFGEALVLLVRREEGALRIAGIAEHAASN